MWLKLEPSSLLTTDLSLGRLLESLQGRHLGCISCQVAQDIISSILWPRRWRNFRSETSQQGKVYKVLLVVLSTFTSIVLHGFRGKCRPFRRVCAPSDGWKCGETSWKSAPTQAALPDGSKFAETPQDFWKWIDNFWTQVGHEIWMLTESKAPLFSLEQDCSCHRSVAWSTKPDSSSMKMTPQDPTSRGAMDEGKSFVQKSWQGFQQVCRYGFLACL